MPKRSTTDESSTISAIRPAASAAGTQRYADRFVGRYVADFYRQTREGLTGSSIALGTYLGDSDRATDDMYAESLRYVLRNGVNVVDTAINYRCQRSERVIGRVLQELIGEGDLRRDEVIVCTKAGYIPLDGAPPTSRDAYEQYVRSSYANFAADITGGAHCIAPDYLTDQLHRSMRNLGVQTVDVFYVHNPEQQLTSVNASELHKRLRAAFEALESCVDRGTIGVYGCATWSGFRLPDGSAGHLSLFELEKLARDVAGADHHFRMVQLPINLMMSEAVRVSTQRDKRGRLVYLASAAADLGIDVVASAPLLQGKLVAGLPAEVRDAFPEQESDANRALAFVRSLPVFTVATGMRSLAHAEDNLGAFAA